MTWSSRAYQTPADLRLMQALTSECWRMDWPAPAFHAGDLDWWSCDAVDGEHRLPELIQLWFAGEADASDLIAWAWFNLPGDIDMQIRPDHRSPGVVGSIVEWAAARVGSVLTEGLPVEAIQVFAPDAEPDVANALGGLGFETIDGKPLAHLTRRFEGWATDTPLLPPGFELRVLDTADVAARVACGRLAFPHSRMTVDRYAAARQTTLYRPALDWIIVAPDGRVAAFALGWLDPATLGLELEPVGVVPEFHRHGLGRAVCLAVIRAARALGASHGMICAHGDNPAASGLYQSLGYEISTWTRPYRRPLSA
ncbi:MAG TPA: GNAT family N-acetyltransferase [Candidatus Limnocylindrales bacterium]|jgi:GNAT superfamily N-acetyltransferase